MPIRRILVPLSGHSDSPDPEALGTPALQTAFVVAQKMDAHVEVFCIEARTSEMQETIAPWMPRTAADELIDMIEAENNERRKRARKQFETVADAFGAPRLSDADPGAGFSTNFLEETGEVHGWLSTRGRLADLIVTACAPLIQNGGVPQMLQVALRETGRPVLISPPVGIESFPKRIAIAWNGSAEASRAVAMAMDFISAAEDVAVIAINEGEALAPDAESLSAYLNWQGVHAQAVTVDGSSHAAGSVLLEQVATVGADMLVMGAYTRNRVQRVIFGGVTGAVLDQMKLPVIMVD